jgi:myo-inositol-1(or 4)-monophosphatase
MGDHGWINQMTENTPRERTELRIALQAARAAGGLLRDHFRKWVDVSYKGAIEPVTELDHQAESMITTILHNAFPDYGLLAEEDHTQRPSNKNYWVVDPLDGTMNYTHGLPLFAVSIGLLEEGQMTLGVVYSPISDELFIAQKGQGAWLNWLPIHVSKTNELSRALLASGFPYDAWSSSHDNLRQWGYFTRRVLTPRCSGCASLDLCYVACGRYDGYWELDLQSWDMAAGALIVTEAGGMVSNAVGEPFDPLGRSILAANPAIFPLMLEGLKKEAD